MFTEFFSKKLMGGISLTIVTFCVGYAFALSRVKCEDFYGSVYFLTSQELQVEAGAEFIKWDGGAGYLLKSEEGECLAISVFFDEASAQKVQKRLCASGKKTNILQKGKQKLYFKGKEKAKSNFYIGALNLFKSYMHILEDCIGELEGGMTQEACKRMLKILEKQFAYSKRIYKEYNAFAAICLQSKNSIQEVCRDIVYLKDLRYLLCWQAEKYVELCNAFSL
jgi:hypothetical protein